jgi:hypothetical protein
MIPARLYSPILPCPACWPRWRPGTSPAAVAAQAALRGVYDRQATRLYGVANAILR